MPTITKISAQKKPGRYNLFLDDRYAFAVNEATIAHFILLPGKELSSVAVSKIETYDASNRALQLAEHFLSYQMRTKQEVVHYLAMHDIDDETSEPVVEKLSRLGLLDDAAYVRLFIKNTLKIGKDGPRQISQKLTHKGISNDLIEEMLVKVPQSDWLSVGKRAVKALMSQKGRFSQREFDQRIKARLMAHGFDSALVTEIMADLPVEVDSDDVQQALKKQGITAYKRFRRYPEIVCRQKMKTYLFKHGFESEQIDKFIDGDIISWEVLRQY